MSRLDLIYKSATELVVKKTTIGQLKALGGVALIVAVEFVFFRSPDMGKAERGILLVFILLTLCTAFRPVKALLSKEHFLFNLDLKAFFHNQALRASFSDIEYVEIFHIIGGSDTPDTYTLNIRLKNKSSIEIDSSSDQTEVNRVAGEIAFFINKEVKRR